MSNDNYMTKPHIYKIVNKINGKFYYGVHNGKNTDTYMGSGTSLKRAQKKYGIENFSKEILLWFDTLEEAYEYEAVIVNEKMINDPNCYNMKCGGYGGTTPSEELRKKLSNAHKGKILSEETKQKLSEINKGKYTGENNAMWGKNPFANKTEEEIIIIKQKMSKTNKGRIFSEETKQKMSVSKKKENFPIVTCPHCGKTNHASSRFKQCHFNNCKHNPNKQS